MDDIQERTLLEAITSIDKTLKRLSERFCSPESVDVAEADKQRLSHLVYQYLRLFDEGTDHREIWLKSGIHATSRLEFSEVMTEAIWTFFHKQPKPPQSPYPD